MAQYSKFKTDMEIINLRPMENNAQRVKCGICKTKVQVYVFDICNKSLTEGQFFSICTDKVFVKSVYRNAEMKIHTQKLETLQITNIKKLHIELLS